MCLPPNDRTITNGATTRLSPAWDNTFGDGAKSQPSGFGWFAGKHGGITKTEKEDVFGSRTLTANRKVQQPVAPLPAGYSELLESLKARIRQAQVRAALSVNRELVMLYWHIGREILQRQEQKGWGAKVIERLAQDLRREFPEMKGLSRANLSICGHSLKLGTTSKLSNSLLDKCRGDTIACCWTR